MSHLRTGLVVLAAFVVMAGPAVFVALSASQGSASFSDVQRLGRNELTAARVDIEVGERTVPVMGSDLAPGDIRTGSIELVNRGTVELRFAVTSRPATGSTAELSPWIDWTAFWSADATTCPDTPTGDVRTIDGASLAQGAPLFGSPSFGADPGDRRLAVGATALLCLVAELDIDTPNDVQTTSFAQPFVASAEQILENTEGGS